MAISDPWQCRIIDKKGPPHIAVFLLTCKGIHMCCGSSMLVNPWHTTRNKYITRHTQAHITHTCKTSAKRSTKSLRKDICVSSFLQVHKAIRRFSKNTLGCKENFEQRCIGGIRKEDPRAIQTSEHKARQKGVIPLRMSVSCLETKNLSLSKPWLFQTQSAGSWPRNQAAMLWCEIFVHMVSQCEAWIILPHKHVRAVSVRHNLDYICSTFSKYGRLDLSFVAHYCLSNILSLSFLNSSPCICFWSIWLLPPHRGWAWLHDLLCLASS